MKPTDAQLEAAADTLGLTVTWHTGVCKGGSYRAPFVTIDGQLVPWHPQDNSDQALMLLAKVGGVSRILASACPAEVRQAILEAATQPMES